MPWRIAPMRFSAPSSFAALTVAACSATVTGIPASTQSCNSWCSEGPWNTIGLPESLPITSGTPAFQARSRLARAVSSARWNSSALAASAPLPELTKSRVPFSSRAGTTCCTSE